MPQIRNVIDALIKAGFREKLKIIIQAIFRATTDNEPMIRPKVLLRERASAKRKTAAAVLKITTPTL